MNAFAKAAQELNLPKEHELSAHQLHTDLFLSGVERILLVNAILLRSGLPRPKLPKKTDNFCENHRSLARHQRRITLRFTSRLPASSTSQVWHCTTCRGQSRVCSARPPVPWLCLAQRSQRLSPHYLQGPLRFRPLGAPSHLELIKTNGVSGSVATIVLCCKPSCASDLGADWCTGCLPPLTLLPPRGIITVDSSDVMMIMVQPGARLWSYLLF